MAQINSHHHNHHFLFSLLLLFSLLVTPTHSLSYTQSKTLLSLSHSLLTRVSNLRASRGDSFGASRASFLANKLERATRGEFGFLRTAWSLAWDYVRNYSWWREFDYSELYGAVSELNELAGFVSELTRRESQLDRVDWVGKNYERVLRVAKSVTRRLVKVFRKSGPLKDVMETVQEEILEGDLLKDCLEVGSNDLKGLVRIVKDMVMQFSSVRNNDNEL